MKTTFIKVSTFILIALGNLSVIKAGENQTHFVLDSIVYLEEEEDNVLNLNTEAFLPSDFNPYAAPENVLHISFIVEEPKTELGFDTKNYLPEGFDPYVYFFDINSIEYIDENDLFELDIDTIKYPSI
ncbi:hypothetical protein [uncultured Muriicola sp.]|uniref:hypothetical protein n=1 Tax=uncultured Muriicola sp. TaxID=1583102 RepID=UPI002636E8DC|nr:hypothetical protein [uncultured Muriicola sp.]